MQFFDNTMDMTSHVESVLKSFAFSLQGQCDHLNKRPKVYKKNNLAQFFNADGEAEGEEAEDNSERRLYSASFLEVQTLTLETQTSSNDTLNTPRTISTGESNNEVATRTVEAIEFVNDKGMPQIKTMESYSSEEELGEVD